MVTNKITVQIIFVFTLLAIALGVFSYRSSVDNKIENPIAVDEIGTEYEEGKIYDMPSNLMFTSDVEETADNSGITLKATVKPSGAYDKALTWSVKWKNPEDWFATDNPDVTKFVTVTSKASDTAEVVCLKPFSSKIEVVATSVSNTNAKATCTLDYMKRPNNISVYFMSGRNFPNTSSPWLYIPVYSSDTNSYTIDFMSSAICNYAHNYTCSNGFSYSYSEGTVSDSIASFYAEFNVTDIVDKFYREELYGSSGRVIFNEENSSFDSNKLLDYVFVFCTASFMPTETVVYNRIVNFLKSNIDKYAMECKYSFTMKSGRVISGTSQYKYTAQSLVTA